MDAGYGQFQCTKNKPLKIIHIITGLSVGGAEMMLFKLLRSMDRARFSQLVISLTGDDPLGKRIRQLGIPVYALGIRASAPNLFAFWRLFQIIKSIKPEIVQTWMYHADLVGSLLAIGHPKASIVWNIRHSNLDRQNDKMTTRITAGICARISHFIPDRIICNSHRASKVHEAMGYAPNKIEIIANGFDLNRFKPDAIAYKKLRHQLKLSQDTLIIGLIGRFHPQKNHRGFINAAHFIVQRFSKAHFVLCGRDVDDANKQLISWIDSAQLRSYVHLLGQKDNINEVTAGFDLAVSCSSFGEGFSNTIGEAMACGIPCVVTDVGDSAYLVGATGQVVAPNDAVALATACIDMLLCGAEFRCQLGNKARQRIRENFSLDRIAQQYENLYLSMARC